ncbi:MAG: DNA-processing protein DprA [Candidatus Eremiobacteraeota bacterium]|nr:DNA-processing protein DprA [Candidatus Eremiobacteraeota bacterium]
MENGGPAFMEWAEIAALRPAGLPSGPPGLYVAGTLAGLRAPCAAIVGTRAASSGGRSLARQTAAALARRGVTVVSGLALGIDTAAHLGALDGDGVTIAVLGSGHRRLFPPRNAELASRIVARGGAVCSPYAPDCRAYPNQFLERNGVVAAFADVVLVVEAPARSGALNTAGWAAGRIPVLAIPGDVDRASAAGCNALIRDGATLARHAGDVFEALRLCAAPALPLRAPASDPLGSTLLKLLDSDPQSLDALIETSGALPAAVIARLTMLELDGAVERREGDVFARTRAP